jgi:glycosyltransferase involved in cell wall biosynthesis
MKISIITVNYNNLDGLQKTRQSILHQTYNNWEWIVIDGGSTQGDKSFIVQHADEMAYWISEPDNGPYNAMNKGIRVATGDYYIFLNSGDTFYSPDVLAQVFCKSQTAGVLYGNWCVINSGGQTLIKQAPRVFTLLFIYQDNICHQAMFIKGDIMKQSPYDESFRLYADWAKWMQLTLAGCTFHYVPYTICNFSYGGLSSSEQALIEKEHRRLHEEILPPAVEVSLKELKTQEDNMRLPMEAYRLIRKRRLYKKIIHTAIRLCHLLDR